MILITLSDNKGQMISAIRVVFAMVSGTYSFFFSSRRRHTRYIGDWSSDVCSSDLGRSLVASGFVRGIGRMAEGRRRQVEGDRDVRRHLVPQHVDEHRGESVHRVGRLPGRGRERSEERRVGKEGRSRALPVECKTNV